MKGWQAWEAGAKEREKAAQRAALKKEKAEGDKMERLQNAAAVDSSPLAIYANFDPDAPSEEFSFINWGTRYSASELDEDIKHLDRYSTTPKFLLECLRRGIAVHHSGLAKGYRVLVERCVSFVSASASTDSDSVCSASVSFELLSRQKISHLGSICRPRQPYSVEIRRH